jgi:hypothetical protein
VRFALIENSDRIRQAVRGIKSMFRADGLLPQRASLNIPRHHDIKKQEPMAPVFLTACSSLDHQGKGSGPD